MVSHELFFFIVGLSIGFMIGCYSLHSRPFPLISSSSIQPTLPFQPPSSPVILPAQLSSNDETTTNKNIISSLKDENSLRHSMSNEELLTKASRFDPLEGLGRNSVRKVAFLFLVRGPLPLASLWETFFKDYKGFYSVYVHAHPSYNDPSPRGSVFHG